MRILLVEDEAPLRETLAARLKANTLTAMTVKLWETDIAWASYTLALT